MLRAPRTGRPSVKPNASHMWCRRLKPWAAAMWAALMGALQVSESARNEAPPRSPPDQPPRAIRTLIPHTPRMGHPSPPQGGLSPHHPQDCGPDRHELRRLFVGLGLRLDEIGHNCVMEGGHMGRGDPPQIPCHHTDSARQSFWDALACFLTLDTWAPTDSRFVVHRDIYPI